MLSPALLLLADSRLPTGGHAHSGGVEAAVARGYARTPDDVECFLAARVPTAGLVTASAAVAACAVAAPAPAPTRTVPPRDPGVPRVALGDGMVPSFAGGGAIDQAAAEPVEWTRWDAAISARTPVAALREASRAQGRALLRTARATWPSPALETLAALRRPHQPLVLGAATAAAGGGPDDAACLAVHHLVGQTATAAVRLLGLDPLALAAVHAGALAACGPVVAEAVDAGRAAVRHDDPSLLPAASTPCPEVLAALHARSEGALFAS